MAFIEALHALLNFDLAFFVDIFLNNLFWLFAFYVMVQIFFEGKNTLQWFLIWIIEIWIILDWEHLTGFVFTAGGFLVIYYITKIAFLAYAENIPALKKHLVLLSAVHAYSLIFFYTFLIK